MVGDDDFTCILSRKELQHYQNCYVLIEGVAEELHPKKRFKFSGLSLPVCRSYIYRKGRAFGTNRKNFEIIINKKVLRVHLNQETENKNDITPKNVQSLNSQENTNYCLTPKSKSILKRNKLVLSSPKSVRFDEVVYITPISPLKFHDSNSEDETPYINGDSFNDQDSSESFSESDIVSSNKELVGNIRTSSENIHCEIKGECSSEIINSVKNSEHSFSAVKKINGVHMIAEESSDNLKENCEQKPAEEMEVIETPKRKRGRPKKNPDPPFTPFAAKKKPVTILPKKFIQSPVPDNGEPKRKRGRPRKKVEFGFHSIVSDIKTIVLPSDLWSAHVSVTSKRSQVCFTRVIQPVSDNVPVECDRSVKFNGSVNYCVKMNNRNVELVAAPKSISCLKDIEILLQIVHDININDPVLRYLPR